MNWCEVINEITDAGISEADIAQRVGVTPAAINKLKKEPERDPLYSTGAKLLEIRDLVRTINKPQKAEKVDCKATWEAYAKAYEYRYRIAPVRNAKVNSQIAQFVRRVGEKEAPFVAAFFLTHNSAYYATKGHAVGIMLGDAEKLRTEWATNKRITRIDAVNAERVQHTGQVFADLMEEQHERKQ